MEGKQHPIEDLMLTAMTSIENMVDVNTIIGDTVVSEDGTTIIPVSKVTFGFAAGGSEFNTNKLNKFSENAKLPFGGGSGAGVNIAPMAFLVVKDGTIKLLTMESNSPLDKLVDFLPDITNKISDMSKDVICKCKKDNKGKVLKEFEQESSTKKEENEI